MKTLCIARTILMLYLLTSADCMSQNLGWAIDLRSGNAGYGTSVEADADGNVYVCGNFLGSLDIDPSSVVDTLSNPDPFGGNNFFVCKYNPSGNLAWGFSIGQIYTGEWANDMLSDSAGNIYITGSINFATDFDPSPAVQILDPNLNGGNGGFFLAKYDSSGNYVWAFTISSSNSLNSARALAWDAAGNLIVTGNFGGNADFDPSANVAMLTTTSPFSNTFVAKYTPQGNYILAFMMGWYPGSTEAFGITSDVNNNIYITGFTEDSTDLDPGPAAFYLPRGTYLAKYDVGGNFIWAYGIQSPSQLNLTEVAADNNMNIIIGGGFQGTIDVDLKGGVYNLNSNNGFFDCFMAKYNSSADLLWAFNIGGTANAFGEGINDIHLDTSNNIYVAGTFFGSMDADPGNGVHTLNAPNSLFAAFTGRYSTAGSMDFAFTTGQEGSAVFVNPAAFYVTGAMTGTRDFDPGPSVMNLTAQNYDCFVAAYNLTSTGLNEMGTTANIAINIYPNPASGHLKIECAGFLIENVELLSTLGEKVLGGQSAIKNPKSEIALDVSDFSPGIYFVRIQSEKGTMVKKVLLKH